MAVVGIICEYNPFHLGHLRQLRLVRAALGPETAVVCAMSGNYVQRGMPAAWDKYARAEAAVAAGADLVLELPLTGVLSSAEGFARAGVALLSSLGVVDVLSFGAECGDGAALEALADRMEGPAFSEALRAGLDQGLPYAAARQQAAGDTEGLLSQPNNILALEYLRALRHLQSPLRPLVIARNGDYHALTPDAEAPSASALRAMLPGNGWQSYVPPAAAKILAAAPQYDFAHGERAVLARLRAMERQDWEACAHGSEGLWSKAWRAAGTAPDCDAFLQAVKSKRYPLSRVRRLLLCAYLGVTQADLQRPVPYGRILAVGPAGRGLLRQARDTGALPLVNPGARAPEPEYERLEQRTGDLFTLFAQPGASTPCGMDRTQRLIIEKF